MKNSVACEKKSIILRQFEKWENYKKNILPESPGCSIELKAS
jgi:hypothetical protein